ncbi:hypothetical protein Ciccas_010458 [Cichlidogyrus casuarinus]|uniref:Carboxylic ester hydrolase n=1 Tax=Cichlidogyrus casuarinus TaxID=1844966 RepID=A0ABD2PU16_9PLAT
MHAFDNALWLLTVLLPLHRASVVRQLSDGSRVEGDRVDVSQLNKTVFAFLGIPYARPPVGRLRFADPQKFPPWPGIRQVRTQPNSCYQVESNPYEQKNPMLKMWLANTNRSEDCLYLNIWTSSATANTDKPVLVWIYGGSYSQGTITLEVYDGSVLSAQEDVVVVSMQYRLGFLGNLYLKKTGKLSSQLATGNQALKDQALALEWVRANIAAFGGSPHKVTLMGESAGAASIGLHWISPISNHLFNRAILESGSPFVRWAVDSSDAAHGKALLVSFFV